MPHPEQAATRPLGPVRLLDVDPDLGARLDDAALARVSESLVVPMFEIAPGPWAFPSNVTETAAMGMIITDGLVGAHIGGGRESFLEVLGCEDVLQPWVPLDGDVPSGMSWQVLQRMRVVVLGRETVAHAATAPDIVATLITRLVVRARRLAFQLAVHKLVRTEERLHIVLWHFAERWGRMTGDGVVLDLPLTHQQLADVIGTQRPSLTTAVGALEEQGVLSRKPEQQWILHEPSPPLYHRLRDEAARMP